VVRWFGGSVVRRSEGGGSGPSRGDHRLAVGSGLSHRPLPVASCQLPVANQTSEQQQQHSGNSNITAATSARVPQVRFPF